LSSRVDTRKANSLAVLEEYPTIDASPVIFRQASATLLNLIKNIVTVKGLTISKDSYSYILELAMSSNVIAKQFILSESQQFSLLLDNLPANSSEFVLLNRCTNLEDLFETISTFAPSIPTQRELESKIVAWKLDYRSVAHLNKSLSELICWVGNVSDSDLRTIDIYHNVIGRILQERLNGRIIHNLQEIRMKISEQDRISDLVQMILCPLKQLIPKNDHVAKNIQKTESKTSNDIVGSTKAITYLTEPNTANATKKPKVRKQSVSRVSTQNDFPRDEFQSFYSHPGPWNNFGYGYGPQFSHTPLYPRSELLAIEED
jgi:hypothetical protein